MYRAKNYFYLRWANKVKEKINLTIGKLRRVKNVD